MIINASNARVFGSEIDLKLRPLPGTFVNIRFSWLESEFIDFVQIQLSQLTIGNDFTLIKKEIQNSGHRLLNSPQFKVSVTAEQTVPLGRYGSLTARYDGAWTDTTYYDGTEGRGIPNSDNELFLPEDTIAQKAFWLHNLRLGYLTPDGSIELAAFVRNLLNEKYDSYSFDGSTFQGTTIHFVGDPRTYGGTLTVSF